MISDDATKKEIETLIKSLNATTDGLNKIDIKKDINSKFRFQRKLSILSKTRTDYLLGGFYDD